MGQLRQQHMQQQPATAGMMVVQRQAVAAAWQEARTRQQQQGKPTHSQRSFQVGEPAVAEGCTLRLLRGCSRLQLRRCWRLILARLPTARRQWPRACCMDRDWTQFWT